MDFFKKTKLGIVFGVLGLFFLFLFINILFVFYIHTIKRENTFKTFNENSTYELVFYTTKGEQKKKLFDYENYHFYGYGICNIDISYRNVSVNLQTFLKKGYLSIDKILDNLPLVSDSEKIKEYQIADYKIIVSNLYKEDKDIVFTKVEESLN